MLIADTTIVGQGDAVFNRWSFGCGFAALGLFTVVIVDFVLGERFMKPIVVMEIEKNLTGAAFVKASETTK